MAKKVLGILGSPRKNGKVATVLSKILDTAELNGHEVKQVDLYDMKMEFCRGCMTCRTTGKCIIDDGLNGLALEIVSSDVVVLAAPTYWANVPAVVKNLFDRMAGYVMKSEKGKPPKPLCSKNQKYILVTACTTGFPFNVIFSQSTGATRAMNEFFKRAGMSNNGIITLTNTWVTENIPSKILVRAENITKAI